LKGIKQLITDHTKIYHIVDLGCGSGDSLRAIADWARKNNFNVQLTGVDMNADVIEYWRNIAVRIRKSLALPQITRNFSIGIHPLILFTVPCFAII
jgi:SAM-dependent methyltransferase